MKTTLCALALGVLLNLGQPSHAAPLAERVVRELTVSQYEDRPDNRTLAVHHNGATSLILKQKATGACRTAAGWKDAVHQSAWFGNLAKCWRVAARNTVTICPVASGRIGNQSCIDVSKASFDRAAGARLE
jgi:hypothetical protein